MVYLVEPVQHLPAELEAFVRDLIEQARANVNDCRLDYIDLQVDKGEVTMFAEMLGVAPIDWHPEPCSHPKVRIA